MKPILFSTPMVQAILDGRKTMTRRVIKPTPIVHNEVIKMPCPIKEYAKILDKYTKKGYTNLYTEGALLGMMTSAPKYKVGDILWVRETWQTWALGYIYKASYGKELPEGIKWRPSIFMPKEACRLFLKVTDIRAERLQIISWEDIMSEGLQTDLSGIDGIQDLENKWEALWKSINGEKSWNSNPFVWIVKFEIEK